VRTEFEDKDHGLGGFDPSGLRLPLEVAGKIRVFEAGTGTLRPSLQAMKTASCASRSHRIQRSWQRLRRRHCPVLGPAKETQILPLRLRSKPVWGSFLWAFDFLQIHGWRYTDSVLTDGKLAFTISPNL
jgi:hypothetical protein